MSDFYRTGMGMTFFNGTMPSIASSLKKIAEQMEKQTESQLSEEMVAEIRQALKNVELSLTISIRDEKLRHDALNSMQVITAALHLVGV